MKVAHLPVKNCDSVIFHSKLLTVRRIPSPLDTSSEFSTYLGPFRGCFIYFILGGWDSQKVFSLRHAGFRMGPPDATRAMRAKRTRRMMRVMRSARMESAASR